MLRRILAVVLLGSVTLVVAGVFLDARLLLGFGAGIFASVLAAGIALWRLTAFARKVQGQLDAPPIPTEGAWDYAWRVRSLDGSEVSFEAARGKVVFLNVWATWCGPCVAEMPGIQRLHDAVKSGDVFFACVTSETPEVAREFVGKHALTVPVFTSPDVPAAFRTRGIPATFVLSRDGTVAFRHVGAARWDDAKFVDLIRSLAART